MENEIRGFVNSLLADGKSKCTIENYTVDLKQFSAAMAGRSLDSIKHADLRAWADGLAAGGLSAATRSRKISAIKSFFRYCSQMGLTVTNPADGLKCPKIEKKQPSTISPEDASKVLQTAYSGHKGYGITWFRDYAILNLFLYTGIRREELTNIRLADVDLERRSILIHGKGNKQRYVFINEILLAVLSEYIQAYRGIFKTAAESEYLFPSTVAVKMSLKTVNNIVNHAFEAAGIKQEGISAHTLRKRFATSAFNNTSDIATISKMLGHSSPAVTMRYVVIDERAMRTVSDTINF